MAAGVTDRLWSISDMVAILEAWELKQHRPKLLAEATRVLQQALEGLFGIFELLHVRQIAAGFDGE